MRTILGCALLVLMSSTLSADDKFDAKLLVGKWSPKEKKSVIIEFTKDGKVLITASSKGKELKFEGTYKLDGNKLTTTLNVGGMEVTETSTVSKLTATELVGKYEDGQEKTLVKLKDK
jgi:uncharacterized protein (TIGR03066 family)